MNMLAFYLITAMSPDFLSLVQYLQVCINKVVVRLEREGESKEPDKLEARRGRNTLTRKTVK